MRMTSVAPTRPVPLDRIDLYDPGRYQTDDQHASWHTLRLEAPVWAQRTDRGDRFWSVTRYQDVRQVLIDDRRFSSVHGTILAVTRGDSAGGRTINLMDQPQHAYVRLPSMRTMATRLVRDRREEVRTHVRRILDGAFDTAGPVDVAGLMTHLPMAGVGTIIGIPTGYWEPIVRWAMAGVAPDDPGLSTGSEAGTLRQAHHQLMEMFSELIRERRRHRRDDLISVLLDLDFGGRRLNEGELLLNCYSFAMGAITTTPQVASHMAMLFARQPDIWQRVLDDPALIPSAVEEGLRWASPTNHLMRRTLAPVEIAGVALPAGELVCAWVGSANRDETVFPEPYRFDPARTPNAHLAFGLGAHRCIGGPAAQVALAILLEEFTDHGLRFSLESEPRHLRSNFINGISHLPMRLVTGTGKGWT
jgi:cytochrome P450